MFRDCKVQTLQKCQYCVSASNVLHAWRAMSLPFTCPWLVFVSQGFVCTTTTIPCDQFDPLFQCVVQIMAALTDNTIRVWDVAAMSDSRLTEEQRSASTLILSSHTAQVRSWAACAFGIPNCPAVMCQLRHNIISCSDWCLRLSW